MSELRSLIADNYTFWIISIGIFLLPRPKKMKYLIDPKRIRRAVLFAVLDKLSCVLQAWAISMRFSHNWVILTSVIGYTCRPFIMAEIGLSISNSEKYKNLVVAPAVLNMLIVSTSFFTDIVFTHTRDLEFQRGPLGYTPHIICVLYYLYFILLIIRYHRQGERREDKYFVLLFTLIVLFASSLETFDIARDILDGTAVVASVFIYLYTYMQYTNRDPLTQLLNRQAYYEYTESNEEKISGVISIDMNGLKDLNDTQGHAAGDEALEKIGFALRSCERSSIRPYRMGGDEFLVLCLRCDAEEVLHAVKQLEYALGKIPYSCSLGFAIQDGTKTLDALNREADANMYRAKREYYKTRDRRTEEIDSV